MIPELPLPEPLDAVDIDTDDSKLPPELIKGLLHQESRGVLGGGSKTNKTWLLISQAIAVASGTKWLGLETVKSKVLYVNMEIQGQFFGKRVREVSKAMKVTLERGQLDILNLRGFADSYQKLLPAVAAKAKGRDYRLVILDPVYKLLGEASENDASDVARLLNMMDKIATGLRVAVFFAAHFTKGNQSEKYAIDRISGSGVFGRDPDTIMTLTKHEEADCFTVDMILRNHPPTPQFVVRWGYPLMQVARELDPTALLKVPTRSATYGANDFMDYLPNDGLPTSKWQETALERMGCSKRTFLRNLRKLEKDGKVVKDNDLWRKLDIVSELVPQVPTPI